MDTRPRSPADNRPLPPEHSPQPSGHSVPAPTPSGTCDVTEFPAAPAQESGMSALASQKGGRRGPPCICRPDRVVSAAGRNRRYVGTYWSERPKRRVGDTRPRAPRVRQIGKSVSNEINPLRSGNARAYPEGDAAPRGGRRPQWSCRGHQKPPPVPTGAGASTKAKATKACGLPSVVHKIAPCNHPDWSGAAGDARSAVTRLCSARSSSAPTASAVAVGPTTSRSAPTAAR
jgi:hypothetical protein